MLISHWEINLLFDVWCLRFEVGTQNLEPKSDTTAGGWFHCEPYMVDSLTYPSLTRIEFRDLVFLV